MIPNFQTNQNNNYFVVPLKFKGVKCATTLVKILDQLVQNKPEKQVFQTLKREHQGSGENSYKSQMT